MRGPLWVKSAEAILRPSPLWPEADKRAVKGLSLDGELRLLTQGRKGRGAGGCRYLE
jgi:hypothetical protein